MSSVSRRTFVVSGLSLAGLSASVPSAAASAAARRFAPYREFSQAGAPAATPATPGAGYPTGDPDVIQEMVGASHFKFPRLEAWASLKSFRPRDESPTTPPDDPGNPSVNFRGERRRNDTPVSTTDPDARLHRKGDGKESKLAYLGHILLDNRHGLVANVCATAATGTAEREAAVMMAEKSAPPGSTIGADKNFDVPSLVADWRALEITPHVAQKIHSAIDGRTTRHAGYARSQRKRKLVEQVFGWLKTIGGLRTLRHRGGLLVDWIVTFAAAAYNLVRMRTLRRPT